MLTVYKLLEEKISEVESLHKAIRTTKDEFEIESINPAVTKLKIRIKGFEQEILELEKKLEIEKEKLNFE